MIKALSDFTLHQATRRASLLAGAAGIALALATGVAGVHPALAEDGLGSPIAVEDLAGIRLIDDAYNANPTSLSAGLATLARLTGGRRIAILGDMLELGEDENALHRAIADYPQMQGVALVHACGPRMRHLIDALPPAKRGVWSEDAADLCARASDLARDGDVVFVKGSKGSRVASVVDAIRRARQTPAPDNNKG